MKLSHLSVLAALCAFSPSVASAITISNATQLTAALKIAKGGEVFDLAPGNYGKLSLSNRNFSSPVTFRSSNAANPAVFGQTTISNSIGVNFDSVKFSNPLSAGQPEWTAAVNVNGSTKISFNKVSVQGSLDNNSSNDGFGISNRFSKEITITNSDFTQLYRAVMSDSSQNITLTGNNVTNIRSEGFNFGNVQGVKITGNKFSEFNSVNGDHPDAIQFWTAGTTRASSDILISDNLIVGKPGSQMQGIFVTSQTGSSLPYQNVVIKNNTLVGTMWHGISVMEAKNVSVTGNNIVTIPGTSITASWIQLTAVDGVLSGNTAKTFTVLKSANVKQANNTINTSSTALADAAIKAWNAANGLAQTSPIVTTPPTGTQTNTASNILAPAVTSPVPLTNAGFSLTPLDESATLVGSNPVGSNAAPNPFSTAVPTNSLALNAQPPGSVMSAVPEPATWAQLILGFGMVGWLMRRGRRHAHVAMG